LVIEFKPALRLTSQKEKLMSAQIPISDAAQVSGSVVNDTGVFGTVPPRIRAFAVLAPGRPLQRWEYDPGPLGAADVEVAVTHCGVCPTDLQRIDNELGLSTYPLVPGHEVVGTITALGAEVRTLATGQRVAVGHLPGACDQREWCEKSLQKSGADLLSGAVAGCGGFAETLRVDQRYAIRVPDALDSAVTAPLLCAGIAVYAPLIRLVRPGSRVGIIGMGVLGHLAVQFACAMGAEVFAISTSPDKEDQARKFGTHHFIVSTEPEQIRGVAGSLDVLLSTATSNLDCSARLAMLRPNGLGVPSRAVPSSVGSTLIMDQRVFSANVVGTTQQIAEMLRFAALHNVRPAVEVLPMDQVNLALENVRRNQSRYRIVLAT
jgi:uncharacterized zinc-type alcohol dehydrogenase-like protein